jgi:predicted nucleic acid-binding protein
MQWFAGGKLSTGLKDELSRVFAQAWIYAGLPQSRETNSMSDKCFVDTNILMYAHDSSTGAKHKCAKNIVEELWLARSGVVSTQVLQELCVNLRRKAAHPADLKTVREIIADYLVWEVFINTGESILEAIDIERRYKVSFWDALIIQAAAASGCAVMYSEDLSNGERYGSVRVVNPLAAPR